MRRLKNGCPLSAPPRAYFYHPQLPKKIFGESWHQTAFTKKNWEVLMKIEGIQALSMPGWTSCSDVRSKRVKPPLIFLGQSYMQDGFFWIKKLCILRHYCTWFRKKAAGPKIHHKLYSVRGLFIWTWKFMVIFQASSMHVQWNCSHKWVMDRNTHSTTSVLEFSSWVK